MKFIIMFSVIKFNKFSLSADCSTLDASFTILIDDSQLPAQHGTNIKYTCPQNHLERDSDVKAMCSDGEITFSGGEVSPCRELGRLHN